MQHPPARSGNERKLTAARLILAFLAALPAAGTAATHLAQAPDLAEMSLEQLSNIVVTSASRRPEGILHAPASIFVITASDIRRAGATSIEEALRLAPNLQVAAIDNSQYGVTARGFNSTTANKLLVLIDGRTVYTPLFSGVFWDAQQVMLEDVDRIEVISGPAATLWGANGVNGVINITTLPAGKTQGAFVTGHAGDREGGGALRYGGRLGETGRYRVYARYSNLDDHRVAAGGSARDELERKQAGFRADWGADGSDVFTFQGDAYSGEGDNLAALRRFSGSNLLARWESRRGDGGGSRLQAYIDRTDRDHVGTFTETLDILDIEYQGTSRAASGHSLIWGAGYRHANDRVGNTAALAFLPADKKLQWGNVFSQAQLAVRQDLQLTLGLKLETNPYTGHEWLPNARAGWQISPEQLAWAAYSRAVRAPSRLDRELYVPGNPPYVVLAGNDRFESEIARVAELGYRAEVSRAASFSLTLFHHHFPNLRSVESGAPGPMLGNGIEGRVTGIEGWGNVRVSPTLSLAGGFVTMKRELEVKPGVVDVRGFSALGNDPRYRLLARASWDFAPGGEFDLMVRRVGSLPDPAVPAYTNADARVSWRLSQPLRLWLVVRNLADRKYAQFGPPATRAQFERTFLVGFSWNLL